MKASRGMGAIDPSKMPGGKKKARRDDTNFTQYKEGGAVKMAGGGLYANIAAKKKRIAAGSGESMRSAGSAGAPKKGDFANAAKTARFSNGGEIESDFKPMPSDFNMRVVGGGGSNDFGLGAGGRMEIAKEIGKDLTLESYLDAGMFKPKSGDVKGKITGGGVRLTKRFAEGGKSTVNAAGNYTKPELRKRIFNAVKAEATAGTGAGQWSARKAQMVAQRYKKAGGGYRD